jgi:hypothetical protein
VYYCILSVGFELTSIPVVDTEQPFQRDQNFPRESPRGKPVLVEGTRGMRLHHARAIIHREVDGFRGWSAVHLDIECLDIIRDLGVNRLKKEPTKCPRPWMFITKVITDEIGHAAFAFAAVGSDSVRAWHGEQSAATCGPSFRCHSTHAWAVTWLNPGNFPFGRVFGLFHGHDSASCFGGISFSDTDCENKFVFNRLLNLPALSKKRKLAVSCNIVCPKERDGDVPVLV